MDQDMKTEITVGLKRLDELLESRILWELPAKYNFRKSVFIEVLIHLKDLLIKASNLDKRITFTDDIVPDRVLRITDVTDLISNFRDASCHSDSYRRKAGGATLFFNEMRGKAGLAKINDVEIKNPYDDEIAFNMGQNVLLLKRHIERAYTEVKAVLEPLLKLL